ncbi:MAG: MBL fold metallo-hydrolase [Eubacteriales bacterium]
MRIVNLSDDIKVDNGLLHEHGLSFYIETENKKYLFDTGSAVNFIYNANRKKINLREVDYLIISHNHYDHIGGLQYFLEINKKAKIFIKKDAIYETFYYRQLYRSPMGRYYEELPAMDRVIFIEDNYQLDDLILLSDSHCKEEYFAWGTEYFIDKNEEVSPDRFTHELFILYLKDDMANIISACSHRGIRNIIETVKAEYNLPINRIIAGLHLSMLAGKDINCTEQYYFSLVDYLLQQEYSSFHTCHCTGRYAYKLLKRDMRNRIDYFHLGDEIII